VTKLLEMMIEWDEIKMNSEKVRALVE
jgi:hypothetical protein